MRFDIGPGGPRLARAVLLALTVAPVLLLTLCAALLQLAGNTPLGPAAAPGWPKWDR